MENVLTFDPRPVAAHVIAHGYAPFDLPEIGPYIGPIFAGYKEFLRRPMEFKQKWIIHIKELSLKADHCYVPWKGSGFDPKDTFMWRKSAERMLVNEGRISLSDFEPFRDWFSYIKIVYGMLKRAVFGIVKEMDRQMPGYDLFKQISPYLLNDMNVIRLLEYFYTPGMQRGDPLASKHTDQSCFTTQWYESHRGLVIIDKNGKEIRYEYSPGRVLFLLGKKIVPATCGHLSPTEHYVDCIAEAVRDSGIGFWHTAHPSIEMR